MKIKPTSSPGRVVIELSPSEHNLPDPSPAAFRIRRIVVPLDFSICSEKALAYAVPFAKQFQATLCLVHVEEACYAAPELIALSLQEYEKTARVEAAGWLERVRREKVGHQVPAEIIVRQGDAVREIVAVASAKEAELIIIATHGRTGLEHVWMGSTAEKVVRLAPCPVLIVREHEREFVPGLSA